MVSLVLEEVTLKSWRGINFEKTAREYKRWSEINPEQLWLDFRDGLGSDDLVIFYDIGIVIVIRWWEERIRKTIIVFDLNFVRETAVILLSDVW